MCVQTGHNELHSNYHEFSAGNSRGWPAVSPEVLLNKLCSTQLDQIVTYRSLKIIGERKVLADNKSNPKATQAGLNGIQKLYWLCQAG